MAYAKPSLKAGTVKPRAPGKMFATLIGIAAFGAFSVAQAREPAPIVFAGVASQKPPVIRQVASAPTDTAGFRPSGNRVEYRYPDRPDMVFGAQGPRLVDASSAPMAFSSSGSAITVNAARKVSHTNTPPRRERVKASVQSGEHARQKIGAPYQIEGKWYVPTPEPDYDEIGIGSWYGPQFHGKPTATGEIFDQYEMTAAHTTLPIPSLARVTNLENGSTVVVRINDRGPFVDDRIIDLSRKAATSIGYIDKGTARVRVQYLGPAPKEANTLPAQYVQEERVAPISKPLQAATHASGYLLQVGSFSEIGNAHALREKMSPLGDVFVKEAVVRGREYFRVYLGPWNSRDAASAEMKRLKRAGVDTLLVSP